jgi:AcrR family transcriptional regulator
MARPTKPDREPKTVGADGSGDGAPATPVRRAPFADNPTVGMRGLRTQQRILDAALEVFAELGYERSTIDRIAQVAGCSRVSTYQYFSGKDDVFRHLAGQVARQLRASAEALEPVTPDAAGWAALRAWVARYGDIYARYEPVFRAFGTAAESDATLAGGSVRAGERNIALFQSKVSTTALPPRQLDPAVSLLLAGATRSLDFASILRMALPDAYPRERIEDAIADVVHRALFGLRRGVNVRDQALGPAPSLRIGAVLGDVFRHAARLEQESSQPGRRALASLLDVGHDVVVRCGYRGTRVDDVVAAAGMSHGAFYRYFENKDEFVRIVAVRALGAISTALGEDVDADDPAALRRWLRRYNAVHAAKGAMIRVWVEAAADDPLRSDRAAVFDWGRRRVVRLLQDRGFGDVDADAVVLLALVEAFGSVPRQPLEVEAALYVIERGFLGRDT